ncbi:MAG: DUF4974 domain-containing protein [Bacteroidales bacterium]|nr:DUF4974 domain-containing protein [Bacteroidales bacterium]
MENEEIDFISVHYRKGRFAVDQGWKRLGVPSVSLWKRYRVAAAIAAAVVISATAAVVYHEYHTGEVPQQTVRTATQGAMAEVKVIDFENASLSDVVRKIETIYNVKVENLPEEGNDYVLSLHYEGTPADLIDVINDILGTQMTVSEK